MVFCARGEVLGIRPLEWGIAALLLAAAAAMVFAPAIWLAAALPAAFLLHAASWRSLWKSLGATLPLALFALLVAALQWPYGRLDPALPARTLAVFWFGASALRLLPWFRLADAVRPGSRLSVPVLFILFTRHFASILIGEARRLLCARRRSVCRAYGGWSFRSLASALAALFFRAMVRAERFYGALLLKGLVK